MVVHVIAFSTDGGQYLQPAELVAVSGDIAEVILKGETERKSLPIGSLVFTELD